MILVTIVIFRSSTLIVLYLLFRSTLLLYCQLFTLFDLLNNLIKKLVMIQYNKTELEQEFQVEEGRSLKKSRIYQC
jgi:hypothetical protein